MYVLRFAYPLSIDRHLGGLHLLTTVNNAAMNIGVQISELLLSILWGYIPRRGITGSYGNPIFNFSRTYHTVFQWLHHFTFSPAMCKGSNFSTSLPIPAILMHVRWGRHLDLCLKGLPEGCFHSSCGSSCGSVFQVACYGGRGGVKRTHGFCFCSCFDLAGFWKIHKNHQIF